MTLYMTVFRTRFWETVFLKKIQKVKQIQNSKFSTSTFLGRMYLQDFFKSPEEQRRSELSVKRLERADELSDLSLLTSMLKGATTENEWNLAIKTNREVQGRSAGKDPVIRATINAVGLQIQEDGGLFRVGSKPRRKRYGDPKSYLLLLGNVCLYGPPDSRSFNPGDTPRNRQPCCHRRDR